LQRNSTDEAPGLLLQHVHLLSAGTRGSSAKYVIQIAA
jgi:hypothetical protein